MTLVIVMNVTKKFSPKKINMVQILSIDIATKTITGNYLDNTASIEILKYVVRGLLWSCFHIEADNYLDSWLRLNIHNTNTSLTKAFTFKWTN